MFIICKVYTYTYVYIFLNTKYTLLYIPSLYNVTCMFVFKTEPFEFDTQLVCFSLGKTASLRLSIS